MELREALGVEALCGNDADSLEPPSRVVRVFLSSTISGRSFRDFFCETVACNFLKAALKACFSFYR